MTDISREEIITFYSETIHYWRDNRENINITTYCRLIGQLLTNYNAVLRSDRMDAIEKDIKELKELVKK